MAVQGVYPERQRFGGYTMNKRGFTMIELMVYLAIVGVVVIIAGHAFSDSTKMRIVSESMIKANQKAENLGNLFRDDVAQMGAKTVIDPEFTDELRSGFDVRPEVFMNVAGNDFSSFDYFRGDPNVTNSNSSKRGADKDSLVMRKVVADSNGMFLRVEEISWYTTNDGILKRSCRTIRGTEDTLSCPEIKPRTVTMASGVSKFVITPATPGLLKSVADSVLFPSSADAGQFRLISREHAATHVVKINVIPDYGATSFTMSGFSSNFREDGNYHGVDIKSHEVYVGKTGENTDDWKDCEKFNFSKDLTYELRFRTPLNVRDDARMFRPGMDHLSIGFRMVSNAESIPSDDVDDMMIFPPQMSEAPDEHVMRFVPRNNFSNACIVFRIAVFSPTVGSGTFSFADLRLKKISDRNYKFVQGYVPDTLDKANVRAFKLDLKLMENHVSGETSVVVPVPSNGTTEL